MNHDASIRTIAWNLVICLNIIVKSSNKLVIENRETSYLHLVKELKRFFLLHLGLTNDKHRKGASSLEVLFI